MKSLFFIILLLTCITEQSIAQTDNTENFENLETAPSVLTDTDLDGIPDVLELQGIPNRDTD